MKFIKRYLNKESGILVNVFISEGITNILQFYKKLLHYMLKHEIVLTTMAKHLIISSPNIYTGRNSLYVPVRLCTLQDFIDHCSQIRHNDNHLSSLSILYRSVYYTALTKASGLAMDSEKTDNKKTDRQFFFFFF